MLSLTLGAELRTFNLSTKTLGDKAMNFLTNRLLVGLFALVLAGCATSTGPSMTPLEIQSLQTRTFDVDKSIVFPSMISVFQDLGYRIISADTDTGLIMAEGVSESDAASKFWLGQTRVSQTKANAFIEEIGTNTSVRMSLTESNESSSWYGQSDRSDKQILDARIYQNAFEKLENAIFVRSAQ